MKTWSIIKHLLADMHTPPCIISLIKVILAAEHVFHHAWLFHSSDSSPTHSGPMVVDIGGGAAAAGTDTVASGQIDNHMIANGPITFDQGTATFLAAARVYPDGTAAETVGTS
jgi:hypothetical protein